MADSQSSYVNPVVYGGVDAPFSMPDILKSGSNFSVDTRSPVPTTEAFAGSNANLQGVAAEAYLNRERVSYSETFSAAASQWMGTKVWNAFNGPSNAPEDGFQVANPLDGLTFAPTPVEREFLNGARNTTNRAWRIEQLNRQRKADEAIADNPKVALFAELIDPTFFGLEGVGFLAGRAAKAYNATATAQRLAAGVAAGTATYAAGSIGQMASATSDKEVIFNTLMMGGMGGMLYREGKLVPKDTAFPSQELQGIAKSIIEPKQTEAQVLKTVERETVDVAEFRRSTAQPTPTRAILDAADVGTSRSAMELVRAEIPKASELDAALYKHMLSQLETIGDIEVRTVPKSAMLAHEVEVFGSKRSAKGVAGYFDMRTNTVVLASDVASQSNVLTHEVAHALTHTKVQYGLSNPGTTIGKLASELEALRQHVAANAKPTGMEKYFLKNTDEFIAGIFSGRKEFHDMLASVKVEGASLLNKVVDTVRKLLGLKPAESNALLKGIGLSTDLMEQRLKTTVNHLDSAETFLAAPGNPINAKKTLAEKLESDNVAKGIALNLYKSASRFSDTAKNIMRDLIEDPVDMRGNSVVSQKMAIRADAHRIQSGLYDLTLDAMETRGFGMLKRALNPREAMRVQRQLERELTIELAGRDAGVVSTAAPEVVKMADKHVELMQHILKEMQAADVAGAKGVKPSNGYFTRHWVADQIERIESRLEDAGYTAAASKAAVVDLVAKSIRGIPDVQVTQDIAKALVDRAKRKGYFEDTAFSGSVGGGGATQIRDILEASGLPTDRVQRVMDTVMSAVDEAGKSPELKRRVDLDMTHSIQLPDGTSVSVVDMLDSNILSNTDRYVNSMSGRVALANKGLRTPSEIAAKRSEYLHSIANQTERAEGAKYFDAILDDINGRPSGEAVPELMRTSQQLTQMVGLAGAGVWQITDYAKMMQTYGMGATVKYALKELPVFRSLLNDVNHSKAAATDLNQVLTANVNYDLRMKPFLQRMEDNFDIQAGAELNIALNHHKQMVPYINGMKFVHGHQAKLAGNLVAQTFSKAASGDVKAVAMLERYGMEPHTIARIRQDIVTNGLDTAKWSDSTWRDVRGPLGKMMDEAVLKSRTGEVPYFAQFSALGKFIFTFRGFTLAAHNKLLAGTLGRDGYAGLSLLMLYQYPLAVAATATNNTIQGKKPLTTEQMLAKAVGQVGALGLYSEIWNMLSGETTRASSPGFIALDRMYQVGGAARAGVMASANDGFSLDQYGKLGGALLNTVPLVASFGPTKALAEQLKGN